VDHLTTASTVFETSGTGFAGHGCASTLHGHALLYTTAQMAFDPAALNVPQDLGTSTRQLHDVGNGRAHQFFSQSQSSIARSTPPREMSWIGHSRPTRVRVSLQRGTDVEIEADTRP